MQWRAPQQETLSDLTHVILNSAINHQVHQILRSCSRSVRISNSSCKLKNVQLFKFSYLNCSLMNKRRQTSASGSPKRLRILVDLDPAELTSAIIEASEKESEHLNDEHVDFTIEGDWLLIKIHDDDGWTGYRLFCVAQDRVDKFVSVGYRRWVRDRNLDNCGRVDTFDCDMSLVHDEGRRFALQEDSSPYFLDPFVPEHAVRWCPCFASKFFLELDSDGLVLVAKADESGSELETEGSPLERRTIKFLPLSYEATEKQLVRCISVVDVARIVLEHLVWLHNARDLLNFSCGC